MNRLVSFMMIGVIAGTILAGFLKVIQMLTGIQAYSLLFNMDYIPLLRRVDTVFGMGYLFHYTFCVVSVLGLYFILGIFQLEKNMIGYIVVYTIGSAVLYTLTGLSEKPPSISDYLAWSYWSFGHALFGIAVGFLIRKWL